ncbi:MAG: PAS domain S-box protein, partial [Nostocaceae cyanobacterium]|nr:PAS domain S-box protein [Nostocaceae cyanobacterium]
MRKAGNSFLELHYSAARAIAQLQQQALQQELINYIVQAMRGTLVLSEVLQGVIDGLHVALDLSSCLIFRPDADQQMTVDYVSTQTTNREHLCNIYPKHHHQQLTVGEPVVLPRIDTISQIGVCSLLIVPMLYQENCIGAIGLYQDGERQWQSEEITLIKQVASHCTLAIVQASLQAQLQAQKSPELQTHHSALSESEFKFRAIIENSIYMISLKDLQGRYLLINPAGVNILGRPAEEILGKRDADLFTNQTGDQIWQTDQQVMQKRITLTYEETAESGGYRRTFQSTKFPYLSSSGELLGIISICRDITANKQVEETLRMFDRAVAASSNGIVIVDARMPDLPMIYINPAFERITGYTRAEVVGENCRFLHGVDTEQSELNKLRLAIREQRSC